MIKKHKIPTIIGIIFLMFGIIAGIFLVNSRQSFKLGANVEAVPKNVRFTNITNSSVTITWTTDIESEGFIKWGTSELSLNKVALSEKTGKNFVHSSTIIGVTQGTKIYLKINSNGTDYDNNGAAWESTTLNYQVSSNQNLIASGSILQSDASTPALALVYITINGFTLSTLSSLGGTYIIPISTYISDVPGNTPIEISIQAGQLGVSQAVIYPQFIKTIPTVVLGRTYDFRTLQEVNSGELPTSSLTVPESVEISSRFEITKSDAPKQTGAIEIDSIEDGEIINTTNPEFFGTGPTNTEFEIIVESLFPQSQTLNIGSNGSWNWSPPSNLEIGEHTVTIKWRDATGILRTISKTFIVSAEEGLAFESTPSATPIQTQTPVATTTPTSGSTTTPTATPIYTTQASIVPTQTPMPTPETGYLTPTLGLFIMGIGVLLSSVFVWNKSNA